MNPEFSSPFKKKKRFSLSRSKQILILLVLGIIVLIFLSVVVFIGFFESHHVLYPEHVSWMIDFVFKDHSCGKSLDVDFPSCQKNQKDMKLAWAIGSYDCKYLKNSDVLLGDIASYSDVHDVVILSSCCDETENGGSVNMMRKLFPTLNIQCKQVKSVCDLRGMDDISNDEIPRYFGADAALYTWDLEEYDRVVYLDMDLQFFSNPDGLFCFESQTRKESFNGKNRMFVLKKSLLEGPIFARKQYFNSGVMVISPEKTVFRDLRSYFQDIFDDPIQRHDKMKNRCRDQYVFAETVDEGIIDFSCFNKRFNIRQSQFLLEEFDWDHMVCFHHNCCKPWSGVCDRERGFLEGVSGGIHQLWKLKKEKYREDLKKLNISSMTTTT